MEISNTQLIWIITAGFSLMALLAFALVAFFQFSQKRILQEQLRQQEIMLEHQQELSANAIRIQDRERERIARDLHDDIGAKLNAGLLYLHHIKKKVAQQESLHKQVQETEEIINRIILTNREISHDLLPPTLQTLGTKAAVEELQRDFFVPGGPQITIQYDANLPDLPSSEGIHLYRALQEMIKNSLTHGQASNIEVRLKPGKNGMLRIDYQDNGLGYDPTIQTKKSSGLGTGNIQTRLQMLGLELQIETAPGKGYRAWTEPRNP